MIQADVIGLEQFTDRLEELSKLNPKDYLGDIGEALKGNIADRFKDAVDPQGKPWIPSRDNPNTLVKSDRLVKSINDHIAGGILEVGTNVEYAAIHNFGGNETLDHNQTMPQRQFIGLGKQDEIDIRDIIEDVLS